MKKCFLILGGVNPRAILAFMRKAGDLDVPFYILAKDESDELLKTDYLDNIIQVRNDKKLSIALFQGAMDTIQKLDSYDKVVILPSSEYLNRFCLGYRDQLESLGFEIPLVHEKLYRQLSDKKSFGELCRQRGLAVPIETVVLPDFFPFVAKPKYYSTEEPDLKPRLIFNQEEKEVFLELYNDLIGKFYFQEFVNGESHYLLYSISKDGSVVVFSQENFVQQGNGGSIIYAKSTELYQSTIALTFQNLLVDTGFWGLAMIEVRKQGDKFIMIECNPRLWGPMQLTIDGDSNIIEHYLKELGFQVTEKDVKSKSDIIYLWSRGILEASHNVGLSYHNCTEEVAQKYILNSKTYDIYNRPDTLKLYLKA
jgi:predicted ATP-grasp superfamily ATP-dependent carboligase